MGEAMLCAGAKNIWETSGPSSQSCYKPKTAPKNKVITKKVNVMKAKIVRELSQIKINRLC